MSVTLYINGLCRCCFFDAPCRSDGIDSYSALLRETFNITISLSGPDSTSKYTICDGCTSRLQDAAQFRTQVLECEKKLAEYVENCLRGDEEIEYTYSIVKEEVETNDTMAMTPDEGNDYVNEFDQKFDISDDGIEISETLRRSEQSDPDNTRLKLPCGVKRRNINSFEVAEEQIDNGIDTELPPKRAYEPPPNDIAEKLHENTKEDGPSHHSPPVESEVESEPTLRTTPTLRRPSSSETAQEPSSGRPSPICIGRPPPADLTQLLQSTQEGRLLLKKRSEPLTTSLRKTLVKEIAGEILKHDPKAPVTNDIYLHWIQQIEQVFPAENSSIYYKKNSELGRAYGRLYDAVTNLKAKFRRNKVYQPRARRSLPDNILTTENNEYGRPDKSVLQTIVSLSEEDSATSSEGDSAEVDACLDWLRRSADNNNLALCTEKWSKTRQQRLQRVLTEHARTYLLAFPCLKRSWGYSLLTADFDQWYPGNENSFENKFPLLKKKLIAVFENVSNKSSFVQELKNLVNDSEPETSNIAALLTIPQLLGPVQIGKKKFSIAEVRHSFIARVDNVTSITEERRKRHETKTLGSPVQPYIIVVGALEKITARYVVVDDLIYELPNICSAVDTCFKIKWALNLKYTDECLPVWQFLQRAVYDVFKATDLKEKLPASVYALLNDCDIKSK